MEGPLQLPHPLVVATCRRPTDQGCAGEAGPADEGFRRISGANEAGRGGAKVLSSHVSAEKAKKEET
jgi:hypothetical protein